MRTVVLRKRSRGQAPAGPPVRRVTAGTGVSLAAGRMPGPPGALRRSWRESAAGQISLTAGGFRASTRATQVRVREAPNTPVTRTRRHFPAHDGASVKIVVSAQLPGWMRSSWAD